MSRTPAATRRSCMCVRAPWHHPSAVILTSHGSCGSTVAVIVSPGSGDKQGGLAGWPTGQLASQSRLASNPKGKGEWGAEAGSTLNSYPRRMQPSQCGRLCGRSFSALCVASSHRCVYDIIPDLLPDPFALTKSSKIRDGNRSRLALAPSIYMLREPADLVLVRKAECPPSCPPMLTSPTPERQTQGQRSHPLSPPSRPIQQCPSRQPRRLRPAATCFP